MNYAVICRLLGVIMCALECSFIISCLVGVYFHEYNTSHALRGWYMSIFVSLILILLFFYLGRNAKNNLLKKEAFAVIGFGWMLSSIVGALPYYFVLPNCSFVNAFFESTSGLTTTGATIFSNIEALPNSILFWRSMSQWIGGLGIVVFFVAILSFLGAGAKILYSHESSGNSEDFSSARIQNGIFSILFIYALLSISCFVAFRYGGMDFFDSTCHMFTTVSTGGFANYSGSLGAFYSPYIEWTSIVFMILGGTNFLLILNMLRLKFSKVIENEEFLAYCLFMLGFSILLFISIHEQTNLVWSDSFRTSAFQVVSIMTTAGFSSMDFDLLLPVAHVFLLILMILGGCSGSTSGGVKIIRIVVAFKIGFYNIEKSFRKKIVRPITINKKSLNEGIREDITVYLLLVSIVAAISLPLLSFIEPTMSIEGVLSAVVACLLNIGPGFAEVGPTQNYAFMQTEAKYLLGIIMIAGRLELYAILALLLPSMWKKFD